MRDIIVIMMIILMIDFILKVIDINQINLFFVKSLPLIILMSHHGIGILCKSLEERQRKGYTKYDFKGVYIIYDVDMNCYYVGQSINVIKRLRGHFNGQASKGGADDLNEALISGHNMEIALLRLQNSSFRDLDDMEAYFIDYFDSYYNGYNRTRGNYVEFRTMGPVHRGGHYVKSFVLR